MNLFITEIILLFDFYNTNIYFIFNKPVCLDMRQWYDGFPKVIGCDTRSFAKMRAECSCKSETIWCGSVVYKRDTADFLKVNPKIYFKFWFVKTKVDWYFRLKMQAGTRINWAFEKAEDSFKALTNSKRMCGLICQFILSQMPRSEMQ